MVAAVFSGADAVGNPGHHYPLTDWGAAMLSLAQTIILTLSAANEALAVQSRAVLCERGFCLGRAGIV
jgi:hypothetical protein